jgi:hypothetical protein
MAAGPAYTPIATNTVSGSTTHTVTFSSISGSYTDLVLVATGYCLTANLSQLVRLNSDSGTNYSSTYLYGNGSTTASGRTTNSTAAYPNYGTGWSDSSSSISTWIMNFMNYSNSTTYKSMLSRASAPSSTNNVYPGMEEIHSLWRNTNAITSISVEAGYLSTHYFAAGTILNLYGITAA